jgi:hypothetical protein
MYSATYSAPVYHTNRRLPTPNTLQHCPHSVHASAPATAPLWKARRLPIRLISGLTNDCDAREPNGVTTKPNLEMSKAVHRSTPMRKGTIVPQQALVVKKRAVLAVSRRSPGPFLTSSSRLASGLALTRVKALRLLGGSVSSIVHGSAAQIAVQPAAMKKDSRAPPGPVRSSSSAAIAPAE